MEDKHSEQIHESIADKRDSDRLKKLQDSLNNPNYLSKWDSKIGRNVVKPNPTEKLPWDK